MSTEAKKSFKEIIVNDWKNDEMFESGCVTMITNDNHPLGEEMRQICSKCGKVRYITKEADG